MNDSKLLCILCSGKLIKVPKERADLHFNIIGQKCESCESEYFIDQELRIKNLINNDINNRNILLNIAKEKVKGTNKTPRIELD